MTVRLLHWTDYLGQPKTRWLIDVAVRQPNGKIRRVQLKSPTQTEAGCRRFERQVVEELKAGRFGVEVKKVPTVAEFSKRFLEWSEGKNKPSTYIARKKAFANHILPALGELRLDEVTSEKVDALGKAMKKAGRGPKTVANVQGYLMRALRLAEEWDRQFQVPRVKLVVPKAPEVDWLEPEEIERFLNAAREWPERAALLTVGLDTGLRCGELLGLRWADIDLARRRLSVRRTYVAVSKLFGTPKSGATRRVELTERATEALRGVRHLRGELVFCHEDGTHYTHREVGRWAPDACKKAGFAKRVTLHGLRHSCCARLCMAGVDESNIMEQLGWTSSAMVRRYKHLSRGHRRKLAEALDEFDKGKERTS
jgi:integrase